MSASNVTWPLFTGLFAALGASLCCAGPLVLVLLGISGAWISNLAALAPARPFAIALALACFAWAAWTLFARKRRCDANAQCGSALVQRHQQRAWFGSVVLATILIAAPYWLAWLL